MKRSTIRSIIILAALLLSALLVVQTIWVMRAYRLQETQINYDITQSLKLVSQEIQRHLGDSSYLTIDLTGFATDSNGLLLIGSTNVSPFPQLLIAQNLIQNGADAVAIYQASPNDFPEGTVANITNLIDVLLYDTSDADDLTLIDIFLL